MRLHCSTYSFFTNTHGENKQKDKTGEKKTLRSYDVGCTLFAFVHVFCMLASMGCFGWLSGSRRADIPCLPGCCSARWRSPSLLPWRSGPPRVLARNPCTGPCDPPTAFVWTVLVLGEQLRQLPRKLGCRSCCTGTEGRHGLLGCHRTDAIKC